MPKEYEVTPVKTYKTKENVIRAVNSKFAEGSDTSALRYIIMTSEDGRFFPVFIGMRAMDHGIHFHFNVVAF